MIATRTETLTATNGAQIEVGTITHEGRDFAALGSVVDEQNGVIVGYPKDGRLHTWDGQLIDGLGMLFITSSWAMPRSWIGSRMYAYRATYKGKRYHGRGFGDGMLLRLRASKSN